MLACFCFDEIQTERRTTTKLAYIFIQNWSFLKQASCLAFIGGHQHQRKKRGERRRRTRKHLQLLNEKAKMDRIPGTEGGAVADNDSIVRQTSPPIVSFDRNADSKTQNAQIAAGVLLGTSDEDRGAGDGNSVATSNGRSSRSRRRTPLARLKHVLMTFGKFVGPGFMVSVAYSKSHERCMV